MPQANEHDMEKSRRELTRGAFAAEQVRLRHYHKALTCVKDDALRHYWETELVASRKRAARLAIALADLGELVPGAENTPEPAHCLADAMDMALSNGDMPAAETIARECMRLIDMRCDGTNDKPG